MIFIILDIFIIQLFDCLKDWVGLVGWSVGWPVFGSLLPWDMNMEMEMEMGIVNYVLIDNLDLIIMMMSTSLLLGWIVGGVYIYLLNLRVLVMINIGVYTITTDKPTK